MTAPYYSDDRVTVHAGDCLDVLATLPDASVDAVVTDPPYGLANTTPAQVADTITRWVNGERDYLPSGRGFMGHEWDGFVPPVAVWDECLRVLKPGGHMAVFAGSRTQDLMGLAIRLAGFDIRDSVAWLYGCLSEDTEVLVNGEWVHYRNAKPGDLALCYDKDRDEYEWLPIADTYEYEYSDTAYRVHSDRTDQIVSRNHRVLIERDGAYVFQFAEEAAREHEIRVPVLEGLPALLGDLPVPHARTSGPQPVLRAVVQQPFLGPPNSPARATCDDPDCVLGLRERDLAAGLLAAEDEDTNVLTRVQRRSARAGVEEARPQGAGRMVQGGHSVREGQDDRTEQPRLEGWRHAETLEGELLRSAVRAVPGRVQGDGSGGRIRNGAPSCRCAGDRETLNPGGSGAPREPLTWGQQGGESVSVRHESGSQAVRGARYTVADLARIDPVDYRGKVWCLRVPTGAFVARRNGKVFVTGNSGFPKSLDVSKAIDKAAGADREVVSAGASGAGTTTISALGNGLNVNFAPRPITEPATPEAARWQGFGTALKPGFEPVILARKPFPSTVAANVLEWGTGALNIDGCRLAPLTPAEVARSGQGTSGGVYGDYSGNLTNWNRDRPEHSGRWPANVALDADQAEALDQQSGQLTSGANPTRRGSDKFRDAYGTFTGQEECTPARGTDQGGASRFFFVVPREGDSVPSCEHANTAEPSSNQPSGHDGSAPSDAATKDSREVTPSNGSKELSTIGTLNGSRPTGETGTRTIPSTDEEFSPESPQQSSTPSANPASDAEIRRRTDTTTTTPSLSKSDGSAAHATSPITSTSREAGEADLPVDDPSNRFIYTAKADSNERPRIDGVAHPTVKSLNLMRWLVRLVTPPGGKVLDPFAGSGTTGEAALLEGFQSILIERETDYLPLIVQRIHRRLNPVEAIRQTGGDLGLFGEPT